MAAEMTEAGLDPRALLPQEATYEQHDSEAQSDG